MLKKEHRIPHLIPLDLRHPPPGSYAPQLRHQILPLSVRLIPFGQVGEEAGDFFGGEVQGDELADEFFAVVGGGEFHERDEFLLEGGVGGLDAV